MRTPEQETELFIRQYGHYTMGDIRRFKEISNPPPILTKQDFTLRYKAGEFGNASPTWDTCNEFLAHGRNFPSDRPVPGLYHLRNKVAAGATHYNLNWSRLVSLWCSAPNMDVWYASEMAPEHRKILQGEIVLLDPANEPNHYGMNSAGLYLMYNRERLPMRDGMNAEYVKSGYQNRMHAEGTKARMILEYTMDRNSLDWLSVLFDRYPGHVIEFSTYECEWGTIPGFNTVFWEVRKY